MKAPGTPPSSTADICSFEDIQLQIGDRVQLETQSDGTRTRHFTSLIGYAKDASVLVHTPMVQNFPLPVREAESILVRAFSGRSAFAFETAVTKTSRSPFPYLHLAFPNVVRTVVIRGALRVRSDLTGTAVNLARNPGGVPQPCTIADLSVSGAQLDSPSAIGSAGERLQVFFKFTLAPAGYEVKLSPEAMVQSCRKMLDEKTGADFFRHGLHFEGVRTTESLLVQSFIQQVMLSDRSRLV